MAVAQQGVGWATADLPVEGIAYFADQHLAGCLHPTEGWAMGFSVHSPVG